MNKNIIYIGIIILVVIITVTIFIKLKGNNIQNTSASKLIDNNKVMNNTNIKEAYFAGGCFWCMEGAFESQEGVKEAVSGYIGGTKETATYEQVGLGKTKHREGVKILYNPDIVSYKELIELYWRQIDPTDDGGQFADRGFHYTTAIYYSDDDEKSIAENSKNKLDKSGKFDKSVVTSIVLATPFYDAEDYHQDYYKKSAFRYKLYEKGSGRKDYKEKTWGSNDITKEYLKNKLTDIQYKVTQENGTERPFDNEYWDNKKDGIYVDLIDGTPLYSSLDKYESGTGWPTFSKPIDINNILEKEDNTLFSKRTEIRGKNSDSHLGHVFEDGPKDKGGLRYCMNSASLKFIEVGELEDEGYGEYIKTFELIK